jgi:hypothetical protein
MGLKASTKSPMFGSDFFKKYFFQTQRQKVLRKMPFFREMLRQGGRREPFFGPWPKKSGAPLFFKKMDFWDIGTSKLIF